MNTEFETTIPFTFDSLLCLSSDYGRFAGMTNDNWQIFDFESLKPVDTITFDAIEMDKLKGAHFVVKSNGTWYLHINNRGKDLFVYPHSKPYYGYFYVGIPGRLEVFGKNSEFLGYANFKGLNYWDE